MKKVLSALLALLLLASAGFGCLAAAYTPQYTSQAEVLQSLGLFSGTDQGFALEQRPTRTQAIVMLVRLLGQEQTALAGTFVHPFDDVADWAQPYVGYAYETGLSRGMSSTSFGSDLLCDAQMYTTFVLRALQYNDARGDFSYKSATTFASALSLIDKGYQNYLDVAVFLRDDMVMLSYRALLQQMNRSEECLLQQLVKQDAVSATLAMPYINIYRYTEMVEKSDLQYSLSMSMSETTQTAITISAAKETLFDMVGQEHFQMDYYGPKDMNYASVQQYEFLDEPLIEVAYGYVDGYAFRQSYNDDEGTVIKEKAQIDPLEYFADSDDELTDFEDTTVSPLLAVAMRDERLPDKTIVQNSDGSVRVNASAEKQDKEIEQLVTRAIEMELGESGLHFWMNSYTLEEVYASNGVLESKILHVQGMIDLDGTFYWTVFDQTYTNHAPGKNAVMDFPDLSDYDELEAADFLAGR